jgi:hypothetical protein
MIFDILEQKIQDAGLAVAGQTLFRNNMPADVMIGVMTRVPLEGLQVDANMPGRHKGRMQVITRHTDPVLGAKLSADVTKVLQVQAMERYDATAERGRASISLFYPETLPIQFPRLDGGGLEFSQHFKVVFTCDPL